MVISSHHNAEAYRPFPGACWLKHQPDWDGKYDLTATNLVRIRPMCLSSNTASMPYLVADLLMLLRCTERQLHTDSFVCASSCCPSLDADCILPIVQEVNSRGAFDAAFRSEHTTAPEKVAWIAGTLAFTRPG